MAVAVAEAPAPVRAAPPPEAIPFELRFQLFVDRSEVIEAATVELDLPWGVQEVALTDDGGTFGDIAQDGTWSGAWSGPRQQVVPVRLFATPAGEAPQLFQEGLYRFHDRWQGTLAWRFLESEGVRRALTSAGTRTGGTAELRGRLEVVASFCWGALVLAYAWLLARTRRQPPP